jgi:hypothetical protein
MCFIPDLETIEDIFSSIVPYRYNRIFLCKNFQLIERSIERAVILFDSYDIEEENGKRYFF